MSTKNIGQIAGLHVGTTPPENTMLIWYDDTPSQKLHKVYDKNLSQWVVLDKNTITLITYSELTTAATSVGLAVGAWFKISDKSNALALAITTTKVKYTDAVGNILIDDLGTNVQYHVTSSNLSIDDVTGVFDNVNKKLVFQFTEQAPSLVVDDYILGKAKRNNVWSLVKYKLSSFLSKTVGNSITWDGGFFFNFSAAISNILDKENGIVSKSTYDTDLESIATAIDNVALENQSIIENATQAIEDATTPTEIYNKALPTDLVTTGVPIDAAKTDTLHTILSKYQRFITTFKLATGIKISSDFAQAANLQWINNSDTVESALGKVQYWFKNIVQKLSAQYIPTVPVLGVSPVPAVDDVLETAISKLHGKFLMEYEYDYIVHNDATLKALSGKVVSNVLIKYGSYSVSDLTSGIVLPASVKRVVAEAGATITVTNLDSNVSAAAIKGNGMCTIHNLKVVADRIAISGFKGVYDCETFVSGSAPNAALIYDCKNVHNVISHGGFQLCQNVVNCKATPADEVNEVLGKGYFQCDFLVNCKANSVTGFRECYNLTNCSNEERMFSTGFYECVGLMNCYGQAWYTADLTVANPGAFALCKKVVNCAAKIQGVAVGYSGSTASFDSSAPCADTAAGGFNSIVGYYR